MKKQLNRVVPVIALLIKWSGIAVVDGRNKVGGTVFATGRGGAFARNKVTPINRRSASQSTARSLFAYFSQLWRTLTDAQRATWNALAENVTYNNIFGDAKKWSGKALYQRLNINLAKLNFAANTSAPDIAEQAQGALGVNPSSSVSGSNLFVNAVFTGITSLVPADNQLYVSATRKLSPGVTAPSLSDFRNIDSIAPGSDTTSSNMLSKYLLVFGSAPALGDNIWLQIKSVNINSGFESVVINAPVAISA